MLGLSEGLCLMLRVSIGLHPMLAYNALSGLRETRESKFRMLDVLKALKGRHLLTMGVALGEVDDRETSSC